MKQPNRKYAWLPWLSEYDQARLVSFLVKHNLLEYDPLGRLPLANGATTDLKINLRNTRDAPEALQFIAQLYRKPLEELHITRFIEVPYAVSGIAGVLASQSGIPYMTLRETPKRGMRRDAWHIGTYCAHDRIAIIDDVITDGSSKITPFRYCMNVLDISVVAIIVLVDREGGWGEVFAKENISAVLWPGMTHNDVRRHLKALGHDSERKH